MRVLVRLRARGVQGSLSAMGRSVGRKRERMGVAPEGLSQASVGQRVAGLRAHRVEAE